MEVKGKLRGDCRKTHRELGKSKPKVMCVTERSWELVFALSAFPIQKAKRCYSLLKKGHQQQLTL